MAFARHQTFYLRDGWIRKGLLAVADDPELFQAPDAAERLGLGVNMVKALRFWLVATGVTVEQRGGARGQHLTRFGQLVLNRDPYLEEDGTLWLLHSFLARSVEPATTWYWFFNHFARPLFNKEMFLDELDLWLRMHEEKAFARTTLIKDFDCLVKTYLPSNHGASPEDTIECPLSILELVTLADEDRKVYQLRQPSADHINPLVVLHTMLVWQEGNYPNEGQVSFSSVLRQPCNVGRTFALSAAGLNELLMRLTEQEPAFAVKTTRTAGLDVISLPKVSADEVLEEYFARLPLEEVV